MMEDMAADAAAAKAATAKAMALREKKAGKKSAAQDRSAERGSLSPRRSPRQEEVAADAAAAKVATDKANALRAKSVERRSAERGSLSPRRGASPQQEEAKPHLSWDDREEEKKRRRAALDDQKKRHQAAIDKASTLSPQSAQTTRSKNEGSLVKASGGDVQPPAMRSPPTAKPLGTINIVERKRRLAEIYKEFDLDGNGEVGADELLALGKTRRFLGHKGGEWTEHQNRNLLRNMGADQHGNVSEESFCKYFDKALSDDPKEFEATLQNFHECAAEVRIKKGLARCPHPADRYEWPQEDAKQEVEDVVAEVSLSEEKAISEDVALAAIQEAKDEQEAGVGQASNRPRRRGCLLCLRRAT